MAFSARSKRLFDELVNSYLKKNEPTEMMKVIERAMDDDEEARKLLDVEDCEMTFKKRRAITKSVLCADYKEAITTITAADRLGLSILSRLSKKLALYTIWVADRYYNSEFSGETIICRCYDVLDIMESLCTDLPAKMVKESDEETEEETEDKEGGRERLKAATSSSKGDRKTLEASRETEKGATSSLEGDRQTVDVGRECKEVKGGHILVRCLIPGCKTKLSDIRRHLINVHVKKGEVRLENVRRLVEVMRNRDVTRGPVKTGTKAQGRAKKWCPLCSKVSYQLNKHLQTKHSLATQTQEYRDMMKTAKFYHGLKELDKLLVKPSTSAAEDMEKDVEKDGRKMWRKMWRVEMKGGFWRILQKRVRTENLFLKRLLVNTSQPKSVRTTVSCG